MTNTLQILATLERMDSANFVHFDDNTIEWTAKNLGVDGGKEAALARAVLLRCSPTEVVTIIIINHIHYCHFQLRQEL